MKRIAYVIAVVSLLLMIFMPTHATNPELLSEMTEDECIEFVKQYNIQIPDDYPDSVWAPFVKQIIEIVEENPEYDFSFSYTATLEFANQIKDAVNDYYGVTVNANVVQPNSEYATLDGDYALQDSTVAIPWMMLHGKYNCYVYSIETPRIIWKDPGYWSNQSFSLDMSIDEIADLVVDDLAALGHERIWYSDTVNTTDLCAYEKIICLRRGTYDYHFMKFESDEWYHKPGNSAILKYKYFPGVMRLWSNERMLLDGAIAPTIYYDSSIIFIGYGGHDWQYISNNNGTHTKYCSICNNQYTVNCSLEYTNITNTRHSASCAECGYYVNSQLCTLTYTSRGNKTHTASCSQCNNTYTGNCSIAYSYTSSNQHRGSCNKCSYTHTASCYYMTAYCGNSTLGDVHRTQCQTCGHISGSATTACSLIYKSNGNNTHSYQCTQCGYVKSGPTTCLFKADNTCKFCGAVKNSAVINDLEQEETA